MLMKLKGLLKGLCILGLTLLPISFSSADSTCMTFNIPDTFVLNKSTVLSFNNLNFNTQINSNDLEHIIYLTVPSSAPSYVQSLRSLFGYYNGQPYLYSAYHQSNSSNDIYQGFPTNVYVENVDTFDVSHITYNATYESIDTFLNAKGFNGGLVCASDGGHMSDPFIYCFKNSTNYYCFKVSSYGGDSLNNTFNILSGSLGLTTNADFTNITSIEWSTSPINGSQNTYYYSTGSCPSVGQLKAGSNLTPNVCYAGFNSSDIYGDSSTFTAGQGLSLFDVFNMYSGGMLLQGWYDTYWNYYKNINSNVSMFEGKSKALLGTFFARQTFSDGLVGSYNILNYCYYVVNNIPDNTSTCVGSNVSSQYSGVVISDYDREDILDSIIGWQDSVRVQSGFDTGDLTDVYNRSYSLFSSRTVEPGFTGIIPSYIIIGFLGIVLLYFLRR